MKSTCGSIAFTARLLGRDPRLRIICASYGDALSAKFQNDTRRVLESAWFRRCYPATRLRRASEQELVTSDGGYRLATSVGGPLTGRGADVIVVDDPHKADDFGSTTALSRVREWFDGALLSRLDDKASGRIVIVMQRISVDDLAGHVLAQGGWHYLDLPALAEVDGAIPLPGGRVHHRRAGEALQPDREPPAVLADLRQRMGTAKFSAQYQQAPVPPGGHLIDWSWLKRFDPPLPRQRGDLVLQSWDTAIKAGELSDDSVGMTFVLRGEVLYLVDLVRERVAYPELKRRVIETKRRHGADILLIEDAGSGSALIQDLTGEGIRVKAVRPEGDKVFRMSGESARIESGGLFVPSEAPWLAELRGELLAFPHGRHDDQVDALSQALRWARNRKRHRVSWGAHRGAF